MTLIINATNVKIAYPTLGRIVRTPTVHQFVEDVQTQYGRQVAFMGREAPALLDVPGADGVIHAACIENDAFRIRCHAGYCRFVALKDLKRLSRCERPRASCRIGTARDDDVPSVDGDTFVISGLYAIARDEDDGTYTQFVPFKISKARYGIAVLVVEYGNVENPSFSRMIIGGTEDEFPRTDEANDTGCVAFINSEAVT